MSEPELLVGFGDDCGPSDSEEDGPVILPQVDEVFDDDAKNPQQPPIDDDDKENEHSKVQGPTSEELEKRLGRKEIYDEGYAPTPEEEQEMKDLAQRLGVVDRKITLAKKRPPIVRLFYPREDDSHAILLKRGEIMFHAENRFNNRNRAQKKAEMTLSSQAVVISSNPRNANRTMIDACDFLVAIKAVVDLDLCSSVSLQINGPQPKGLIGRRSVSNLTFDDNSFKIFGETGGRTVVLTSPEEKESWMEALDTAITAATAANVGGEYLVPGWKHKVMRRSIYSAALLGDDEMLRNLIARFGESIVGIPDESGYSAAHYAAMNGHRSSLQLLLDAGADSNAKDIDMMTPMDYVKLDEDDKDKGTPEEMDDDEFVKEGENDGQPAFPDAEDLEETPLKSPEQKEPSTNPFDDDEEETDVKLPDGSSQLDSSIFREKDEDETPDDDKTMDTTAGKSNRRLFGMFSKKLSSNRSSSGDDGTVDLTTNFSEDSENLEGSFSRTLPRCDSLTQLDLSEGIDEWKIKVEREEVYRKEYLPTDEEDKEMKDLARYLGIADRKMGMGKVRPVEVSVLHPTGDEPRSILLKRGVVKLQAADSIGVFMKGRRPQVGVKELIMVTNALIIASPNTGQGINRLIKRPFEDCISFADVIAIMDLDLCSTASLIVCSDHNSEAKNENEGDATTSKIENAFRIHASTFSYTFFCKTKEKKDAWLQALDAAVVGYKTRSRAIDMDDSGWKHKIMRTSMYSAAIFGDRSMLEKYVGNDDLPSIFLDDDWGYTPTHYAAMFGNVECLKVLLDAGVDANAEDLHGMSPVSYASRKKDRKSLELLGEHGGMISDEDKVWMEIEADLEKWESRVNRADVHEKGYIPTEAEDEEIEELEKSLGVTGGKMPMKKKGLGVASLLHPPEGEPRPVLLKRGPLRIEKSKSSSKEKEKELVLLTNGLIVANVSVPAPQATPDKKKKLGPSAVTGKSLLSATNKLLKKQKYEELVDIRAVMDLELCTATSLAVEITTDAEENKSDDDNDDDDNDDSEEEKGDTTYDDCAFRVVGKSKSYTFICDSKKQKLAWIYALGVAIVGAHRRNEDEDELGKGWRHKIMRTTAYSAAICGDTLMLDKMLSANDEVVDHQDDDGYTPAHYAVMFSQNACLAVLLDAGADPDAADADLLSPVDHASAQRSLRALEMLEAQGGTLCDEDREWLEEEARAFDIVTEGGDGTGAAGFMNDAINQMNERGERLKQLQNKTATLVDVAANYKDMASQLKKKTKDESKLFGRK